MAKAISDAKENLPENGEKLARSHISEIAANSSTDENPTSAETPTISITEVVLEKPRSAQAPVINGQHGFVEDLFSNWVDAPSSASAWIARNAALQGIGTDIPAPACVVPLLPGPEAAPPERKPELQVSHEVVAADAPAETPKNGLVAKPEPAPANALAPAAVSDPPRIAIPQAPLATTFTVTQYGLWRVSMPATVSPIVAVNGSLLASPVASIDDPQSGNKGKTAAYKSPAEMAKASGSNAQAKTWKVSEKVLASLSTAKPSQEKTLVAATVKESAGQPSTSAATDIRPLLGVIKSSIERLPGVVVGTAEQFPVATAAAVVPDAGEDTATRSFCDRNGEF